MGHGHIVHGPIRTIPGAEEQRRRHQHFPASVFLRAMARARYPVPWQEVSPPDETSWSPQALAWAWRLQRLLLGILGLVALFTAAALTDVQIGCSWGSEIAYSAWWPPM